MVLTWADKLTLSGLRARRSPLVWHLSRVRYSPWWGWLSSRWLSWRSAGVPPGGSGSLSSVCWQMAGLVYTFLFADDISPLPPAAWIVVALTLLWVGKARQSG